MKLFYIIINEQKINLSYLPNGVYILMLYVDDQIYKEKIINQ